MNIVKLSKDNLRIKIPDFIYGDCFIAGGAIRDSILLEKRTDIDIFGATKEKLDAFIEANLKDAKEVYTSDRMRTFIKDGNKIQVIYIYYASIAAALDSFDFTLCQFAYDGKDVYCNPQSLLDIFRKKIVIHKLNKEFAIDSLRRVQKYIKKGYTICNGGWKQFIDTIRDATQEEINNQMDFYPDGKTPRIIHFD